jgi:hypothetical protein
MEAEKDEDIYTVSIKGNGVTIEKTVPAQVARQMINVIMGGAASSENFLSPRGASASRKGADGAVRSLASGPRRTSLREFLEESQAKRNPDKIISIAEYLLQYEEVELFTKEEIKSRFRLAGEAAPANFPRDFTWAVNNGWIAEDLNSAGSFYVTQKGRDAIENKFSSEIKKGTPQPTGRRRSRKISSTWNSEN